MPFYVLDYERNLRGNRTIHVDTDECDFIPLKSNRLALGFHDSLKEVEQLVKRMDDRYEFCTDCCLKEEEKGFSEHLISYF